MNWVSAAPPKNWGWARTFCRNGMFVCARDAPVSVRRTRGGGAGHQPPPSSSCDALRRGDSPPRAMHGEPSVVHRYPGALHDHPPLCTLHRTPPCIAREPPPYPPVHGTPPPSRASHEGHRASHKTPPKPSCSVARHPSCISPLPVRRTRAPPDPRTHLDPADSELGQGPAHLGGGGRLVGAVGHHFHQQRVVVGGDQGPLESRGPVQADPHPLAAAEHLPATPAPYREPYRAPTGPIGSCRGPIEPPRGSPPAPRGLLLAPAHLTEPL